MTNHPTTINLHIHTTHSDGSNTPAEIVAMLKEAGVTAFSITDHDTVEGNVEAAVLAKEHGLTHINGIEISCRVGNNAIGFDESWGVHILGYGFDMDKMRIKLAELESKSSPTAKYTPTIGEGVGIIYACGGLAVWAHPFDVMSGRSRLTLSEEQVYKLLFKMIDSGINGMEVYYQQYTPQQIELLNTHAQSYYLYPTVGTDYHNFRWDTSKHPELKTAATRATIAFDVDVAGLEQGGIIRPGAIIRRITGADDDIYCDKCEHICSDSVFHPGLHFWVMCRKKMGNHGHQILAYSLSFWPSHVERPDWCPLKEDNSQEERT